MAEATPFAAMVMSWELLDREAAQLVGRLGLRERPTEVTAQAAWDYSRAALAIRDRFRELATSRQGSPS